MGISSIAPAFNEICKERSGGLPYTPIPLGEDRCRMPYFEEWIVDGFIVVALNAAILYALWRIILYIVFGGLHYDEKNNK
jgi:hypothetical protein